jgi:hypothetical protein
MAIKILSVKAIYTLLAKENQWVNSRTICLLGVVQYGFVLVHYRLLQDFVDLPVLPRLFVNSRAGEEVIPIDIEDIHISSNIEDIHISSSIRI